MVKTIKTEVLVLGAGITGLTVAEAAAEIGHKVLLLSNNIGGLIGSYRLDDFSFDYGGHVYTPYDVRTRELLTEAGAQQHERKAFYFDRDGRGRQRRVAYPVQDHAKEMGLTILPDRTIKTKFQLRSENFEKFLLRKFGKDFYFNWAYGFNKRVWTISPKEMSSDWVKTRVKLPLEDKENWGPNASFLYAPGHNIKEVLLRRAEEASVHIKLGTFEYLRPTEKIAYYRNGGLGSETIKYKWVISTLPIVNMAHYMEKSSTYNPSFPTNRVRTVGIGLNIELDEDFHWAYANLREAAHRTTLLSRYHRSNAPTGRDSLLVEFPYRNEIALPKFLKSWLPEMHAFNFSRPLHVGVAAAKSGGFRLHLNDIETVAVGDTIGYPIPTIGIRRLVTRVKRSIFGQRILSCGRWGSHGYFNLDHCIQDAEATIEIMENGKLTDKYLRSTFYYG